MPKKNNRSAYSLLELSIVIVIISVLISGAMTTAVGNINSAKVKITKDRMKVIYNALGSYLATNGRLPCPADITALKTSSTYGNALSSCSSMSANVTGVYVSTTDSRLLYGMLPSSTLGLSKDFAEDGFEDKIAYVVDKNFTDAANLNSSPNFSQTTTFSIATSENPGVITVQEKNGSATLTTLSDGIFVLISYGPNKQGAFGINSSTQNASPTGDEAENDYGGSPNFDKTFVSISSSSDSFDDIITVAASAKMMVANFNLYRLLPCKNNLDTNYNSNTTPTTTNDIPYNAWFGQTIFGEACTSSDFNKNYTKKCGQFGSWITQVSCSLLP